MYLVQVIGFVDLKTTMGLPYMESFQIRFRLNPLEEEKQNAFHLLRLLTDPEFFLMYFGFVRYLYGYLYYFVFF